MSYINLCNIMCALYVILFICINFVPDKNECASKPCLNQGTCLDRVNRYICRCKRGYRGLRCKTGKSYTNTDVNYYCFDSCQKYNSCQCVAYIYAIHWARCCAHLHLRTVYVCDFLLS